MKSRIAVRDTVEELTEYRHRTDYGWRANSGAIRGIVVSMTDTHASVRAINGVEVVVPLDKLAKCGE
jgi:hypothetical protein